MAALMNHRRAARVAPLKGASRVGLASCDFVLDPNDRAIEESIKRIERKTYVKDGLIPEIQYLLLMPPAEAKAAFIGHLTQYSLVTMLLLASLLGTALAPLDPEAYPSRQMSVAAFNMMAMIICCGTLFGTCTFVLEAVTIESNPTDRIHSVIAKADKVFGYGIGMAALALQGTAPLIVLRAWVSGLNQAMCITLTAVVAPLWVASLDVFEAHLQKAHPMMAQLWVIVFAPWRYRKEPSHAAVDELVAGLRYLQQARDKTLTPAQLGACLDAYFVGDVLLANEAAFLALLEAEAGGRLAPAMERLARKAFEKVLEGALEGLASEAINARKTP